MLVCDVLTTGPDGDGPDPGGAAHAHPPAPPTDHVNAGEVRNASSLDMYHSNVGRRSREFLLTSCVC